MTSLQSLEESYLGQYNWYAPLEKIDSDRRIIAGYASVEIVDRQNEIIPISALEEAWEKFKANPDFAINSLMHTNIPVGKILFEPVKDSQGRVYQSGVDDKGLFIVAEIRDDIKKANECWKAIEEGRLRGFSIGGEALVKTPIHKNGVVWRIDKLEIHEIAIVDRPANPASLFTIVKKDDLIKLDELLKNIPDLIISDGIVKIVGSTAELGEGHDYDIMIKAPKGSFLYRAIQTRIYNELRRRNRLDLWEKIQFLEPELEGPYTDYKDLFDLVLIRSSSPIKRMTMREEEGVASTPLSTPQEDGHDLGGNEPTLVAKKLGGKDMSEEKKEAEAPLTLETIAAELAKINERLENLEKAKKPKEEEKYPYPEKKGPRTERERLIAHYGREKAEKLIDLLGDEAYRCLPPRGSAQKGEDDPLALYDSLDEEIKGKLPEGLRRWIEEHRKKKEDEEKAEKPKKEPEKYPYKYPYPEKKELEEMVSAAIDNALKKILPAEKRSLVPKEPTEVKPLSLWEVYKTPWNEIHREVKKRVMIR